LPPNPPVSVLALKVINETTSQIYAGLFNDTTNGAGIYKLDITVGVEEIDNEIPSNYSLEQNYPNPFNPSTTIQFSIPHRSMVTLKVYDLLGNKIATLVNEEKPAGSYEIDFIPASSIKNLASSVYFYQLRVGDYMDTKKMILLK
jgi:hypothetical protein